MRTCEYLVNLTTHIVGKRQLEHYIEKRRHKSITSDCIRQLFMLPVKEAIGKMNMTYETVGIICALGGDFDQGEYRDASLVTHGTNAWSAVFLSTSDSGRVMITKIAVATILTTLIRLINEGQPDFAEAWMPMELSKIPKQSDIDYRTKRVYEDLGW